MLPSREAMEKMLDTVSDSMAYDPWGQTAPGAHSFAVGKAKSIMEAGEVLYITCNFIDDEWNLHRLVHQAYLVLPPGDHHCNASASSTLLGVPVVSGELATERVVSCIFDDVDEQEQLKSYYPLMVAADGISITTGGIAGHLELKHLMDQKLTSVDTDVIFCTASMDHVLHSIARCLVPDSDTTKDVFSELLDLRCARQDRQMLLSEAGLDDPLESNEHWYWRYCALAMADHHLLLTLDSQKLLCNLWGAVYSAIKRVSASNAPTANLCLEELLKVRGALQSQLSAAPILVYVPLITKALEIVDKAIEDSYLVWSVPLVLDPRYKLRHIEENFQKAFDDSKAANYTSQVRKMVKELYASYENPDGDSNGGLDEEMMAADSASPLNQALDEQCHSQDDSHAATKTELDDYLEDSPARIPKGFDFGILNWWKVHGSVQYPTVARMARAALAMPTCSKLTSDQTAQVESLIRGYTKI